MLVGQLKLETMGPAARSLFPSFAFLLALILLYAIILTELWRF